MKSKNLRKSVILFLVLGLVMLGFRVTNLQEKIDEYESKAAEQYYLLNNPNGAKGYSCGVLTKDKAEGILNSKKVVRTFGQSSRDRVQETKPIQPRILWTDNCGYQDLENNNKYIELYISTFESSDAAASAFPNYLRTVNDKVEISNQNYGQSLMYDGGAFYLLRDNEVIQIAASNGNPSEIDIFSKNVFNQLIPHIE